MSAGNAETAEAARASGRWATLDQLEALANAVVARARRERGAALRLAERVRDGLARVTAPLTGTLRFDGFTGAAALARAADRLAGSIAPLAQETGRAERRPARILQVGCGLGEGTLALARALQRRGLPAEVVGTDTDEEALCEASLMARRTATAPVRFTAPSQLPGPGDLADGFDLVVALPGDPPPPGGLARLIAAGLPLGRRGFHAALPGQGVTGLSGAVRARSGVGRSRDASRAGRVAPMVLTPGELALVGALAAPQGRVAVRSGWGGYDVLSVYP